MLRADDAELFVVGDRHIDGVLGAAFLVLALAHLCRHMLGQQSLHRLRQVLGQAPRLAHKVFAQRHVHRLLWTTRDVIHRCSPRYAHSMRITRTAQWLKHDHDKRRSRHVMRGGYVDVELRHQIVEYSSPQLPYFASCSFSARMVSSIRCSLSLSLRLRISAA